MSSNSKLAAGDTVKTEVGTEGKVMLVTQHTAFVEMINDHGGISLISFLLSELTKIDTA